MSQVNDAFTWLRESVSTVFRHILPGILIIAVSTLSKPSWFPQFDINNTSSIIILGAIAMVIGNTWYVFHRYCILQVLDFLAYYFRCKGQPSRVGKSDYRGHLARHVSKYFSSLPNMSTMGKHIRDRFSSFNFMFIVSEVFFIFTLVSEDATFLHEHLYSVILLSSVGLISATWQYLIVRVIDEEFAHYLPKNRFMTSPRKYRNILHVGSRKMKKPA